MSTTFTPDLTIVLGDDTPRKSRWHLRAGVELLSDQLAGMAAWTASCRAARARLAAGDAPSREARFDLEREGDILSSVEAAMTGWAADQLRDSGTPMLMACQPRAVVAHRNEWFRGKVSDGLWAAGVQVVAQVDNGADALGIAVAEQPDLLVVEDRIPMLSGTQLLRELRRFAPATVAVAQASGDQDLPALLEAGARTAFTRRVPPAEVAQDASLLFTAAADTVRTTVG